MVDFPFVIILIRGELKHMRYNAFMGYVKKLLLVVIGTISIFLLLFCTFTRYRPQNSPKKATVHTKTVNKLSRNCIETYKTHVGANNSLKIPIVLYHYVENIEDKEDILRARMNVTPYTFEQQLMRIESEGQNTVFVRDIPEILNHPNLGCYPAVALTFDDGYEDFYKDVFPVLKKYKMKATVYLIVNYIGRKDFLNEAEIKEILKSGLVEIGSHTMDHPDLTKLSQKEIYRQVSDSKDILESWFGVKIDSFAYPLGKYDGVAEAAVVASGYKAAVTVKSGENHSLLGLYVLERVRPPNYFGN